MASYLGRRSSEVEALRWELHIDLDGGWALLPGTNTRKSRRRVLIAQPLREFLAPEWRAHGPVVARWTNVRRDIAAACAKIGLPHTSPNHLRRSFASWLRQRGVDSMAVAKMMGHTTSRMVEMVYGHPNDDTFLHAIQKMPTLPNLGENRSGSVADSSLQVGCMRLTRHEPGAADRIAGTENQKAHQTLQPGGPMFELDEVVPGGGIEPPTRGFSVPCSTD